MGEGGFDVDFGGDGSGVATGILPADVFAETVLDVFVGEQAHLGGQQAEGRIGIKAHQLCGEALRVHAVVGVHACDEWRAGITQAPVEGCHQAQRRLADEADARIVQRATGDEIGGIIPRAVVDGQQFVVGEGLCGDGVEALTERAPGITERQDDADPWRFHGPAGLSEGSQQRTRRSQKKQTS